MSRTAAIVTLIVTLAIGITFAVAPDLDLMAARHFYEDGSFAGSGMAARTLRNLLYFLPSAVFMGMGALYLAARFGVAIPEGVRPRGRSLLFLALSLALGPGLIVNVILKDHGHRPRPVQTQEFGGPDAFRPWYRTDGACDHNCSFVSGETAAAAWLIGVASLAPPPARLPAMVAAGVVATATGLARMAFGGHYLSDVIFAGLIALLILQVLHGLLLVDEPSTEGHLPRRLRGEFPPL